MTSIRLGANLFQKEKVISELQNENSSLKQSVSQLEVLQKQLEVEKNYFEKADFESKNQLKLLEIENQQLVYSNKQLKQEMSKMKDETSKKEELLQEKTIKALYLEQDLEDVKSNNNIKTNKIENYQSEVVMQEKRNLKLEKMIESLNEKLEQKENDIEILKKSIKQKDNHIAILLKEKDKAFKSNNDKENTQRPNTAKAIFPNSQTSTTNNPQSISNNSTESNIKADDLIRQLKSKVNSLTKQVQDKEIDLKKTKDENFQLMTRLKNTKR